MAFVYEQGVVRDAARDMSLKLEFDHGDHFIEFFIGQKRICSDREFILKSKRVPNSKAKDEKQSASQVSYDRFFICTHMFLQKEEWFRLEQYSEDLEKNLTEAFDVFLKNKTNYYGRNDSTASTRVITDLAKWSDGERYRQNIIPLRRHDDPYTYIAPNMSEVMENLEPVHVWVEGNMQTSRIAPLAWSPEKYTKFIVFPDMRYQVAITASYRQVRDKAGRPSRRDVLEHIDSIAPPVTSEAEFARILKVLDACAELRNNDHSQKGISAWNVTWPDKTYPLSPRPIVRTPDEPIDKSAQMIMNRFLARYKRMNGGRKSVRLLRAIAWALCIAFFCSLILWR